MRPTKTEIQTRGYSMPHEVPGAREWTLLDDISDHSYGNGFGHPWPLFERDREVAMCLLARDYIRFAGGPNEIQATPAGLYALKGFHELGGHSRLDNWNVDRWDDFESIPVGTRFCAPEVDESSEVWIRTENGCVSERFRVPIVPDGMNEYAPFSRAER